jgi:hypothetical protein
MTAREYLQIERAAEIKSEFLDGEMFAMAGGTRKQSRIAVNIGLKPGVLPPDPAIPAPHKK